MQKTYWWRVIFVLACIVILIGLLIGPCEYKLGKCLGGNSILVARTFFHVTLSLLIVTPFLFFVRDVVFLKWLRFGLVWFFVAVVLIALAPEYSGGWGPNLNPTKESVSIWMAFIFVIMSFAKLACDSWKMRRMQ